MTVAPITLDACVAGLEAMHFDPADDAAFDAAAPLLAGLAADRGFLGIRLIAELGRRARDQERANDYGAQVVMLHRGDGWFIRANIWPAADDPLLRANGPRRFFYGVPHDHNFSFLTAGYFGPGYVSDYYVRASEILAGVPGEQAGLRFVKRSALMEGAMRLYRAHHDIHRQHPPLATSVSLNIVQATAGLGFADQYEFDLSAGTITRQRGQTSTEALIALLPALGGANGRDLLDHLARTHPAPRIRFAAIASQAGAAPTLGERVLLLERATADHDIGIAMLARARLGMLERGRGWIERAP